LKPLLEGEISSCYSMTEPHAGADPTLFKTRAVKDGKDWVINGEKWFSSNARYSSFLIVMAVTDPAVSPYEGMSMLIVPTNAPGVNIMRNVGIGTEQEGHGSHAYIRYEDVRVSSDHMLGAPGSAFVIAQTRLGGGRIHHAMRTVGQLKLCFDMMCERALSRSTRDGRLADYQMVQEKIADSYASIRMLRLFVLETAWKIDHSSTHETRTDLAAVKYTMAKVLREVSFNALHILGSLGTTNLTPIQAMYAGAPTMGIADGVDEVHKATVSRNVLRSYEPHEGFWPTEYIPAKRDKAREKFEPLFAKDPALRAMADGYAKYIASRG